MRAKEEVQNDIQKYQDWLEVADTEEKKEHCNKKIDALQKELGDIEKNEAIQADIAKQQEEEERINAEIEKRLKEKEKEKKSSTEKKISGKEKTKSSKFNPADTQLDNADQIAEKAAQNAEKIKKLNQQ